MDAFPIPSRSTRLEWLALLLAVSCAAAKPRWIDFPYEGYPKESFVVAVGSGQNLEAAKRDAIAGIAAFLGIEIEGSTAAAESEEVAKRDGRSTTKSSGFVAERVKTVISQKLSNVTLERADTSEANRAYVLAVLEKRPFLAAILSEAEIASFGLAQVVSALKEDRSPSQTMLQNLAQGARALRSLHGAVMALNGKVPEGSTTSLREALAILSRFGIQLEATPSAGAQTAGQAAPERPVFDPKDPRLLRVVREIANVLGHPVDVSFDLELMPRKRQFFDDVLDNWLGLIPRDLERMKQESPAAFAYAAPRMKRIDLHYDGGAEADYGRFDVSKGHQHIHLSRSPRDPSAARVVSPFLQQAYLRDCVQRFGGQEPEEVPRAQWPAYLDFLSMGETEPSGGDRSPEESFCRSNRNVDRLVRFSRIAKPDVELSSTIAKQLIAKHSDFAEDYKHRKSMIDAAAARGDCMWKRAEASWVRWLNESFENLADEQKAPLFTSMLRSSLFAMSPAAQQGRAAPFPGWQWFEQGLRAADRWLAAGTPAGGEGRDSFERALFDATIAPLSLERGAVRRATTGTPWYELLLRSEDAKARLAPEVLERKSTALAQTVMANLLSAAARDRDVFSAVEFFWRGLEASPEQWRAAAVVIADARAIPTDFLTEGMVRLWRTFPRHRGPLILALVQARWNYRADVSSWGELKSVFGSEIGPADLADYLGLFPSAVEDLPMIWPALSRGWSRADVVLPAVESHLKAGGRLSRVRHSLEHLLDQGAAERRKLRAFLQRTLLERPSEAIGLERLLKTAAQTPPE